MGLENMHHSVINFVRRNLSRAEKNAASVLDVGSYDVNGSMRTEFGSAAEYLGIDVRSGPNVDLRIDLAGGPVLPPCEYPLLSGWKRQRPWDIVLCLNTLEHARDWRGLVNGIKSVCRPGGVILLTVPSPGYPIHEEPDYWRFTTEDVRKMFSECELLAIRDDPAHPGVFVKVRVPEVIKEVPTDFDIYSMSGSNG